MILYNATCIETKTSPKFFPGLDLEKIETNKKSNSRFYCQNTPRWFRHFRRIKLASLFCVLARSKQARRLSQECNGRYHYRPFMFSRLYDEN